MWGRVRKFLSFRSGVKLLIIEALFYLGWARILKALPFSKVAPSLGIQMKETTVKCDQSKEEVILNISNAVRLVARHTWWESMCLVMAIAGMKMLERRNIESTLYLGTGRDASGKMIAHAWLRSGPFYLTGYEVMKEFTVVGTFGNFRSNKGD
jgi:hypothetical protein